MTRSRDLADSADKDITGTLTVDAADVQGNITVSGTVDGVDVAARDAVLTSTTTTAGAALPKAGGAMTGAITTNSTFDGVDIATRDAVLTSTTTTATAALPKAGGAMTGAITTNSTFDGRDVATDGTKLDGIEASADVTDTANVTAAGALMDSELTNLAAVKAINQSLVTTATPTFAGMATTANVTFADSDKAIFGAGSDLQIYHDGSNSYIDDQGTGRLYIRASDQLRLQASDSENYALFAAGGAVKLYYDNVEKFDTTNTGVNITGTLTADGLTVSGSTSTVPIRIDNTGTGGDTWRIWSTNDAASDGGGKLGFYNEDTSTRAMTLDSAGNVGIGTSSPNAVTNYTGLTLNNSTYGGFIDIENNGTHTFRLLSNTSATYITTIESDPLVFSTANTERLRIDSSGNVLVGTTTLYPGAGNTATGNMMQRVGTGYFSRASGFPLSANRNSDGSLINLGKDGSTVGSIASHGGSLVVGGGDVGIGFYQGANALVPYNSGTNAVRDAAIDLGYPSTYRWRDLYLSGGVFLGGTGAANKLEDYETGSWSPSFNGYTTGFNGFYTKIGNLVTCRITRWANIASGSISGNILITGLPFTAGDNGTSNGSGQNTHQMTIRGAATGPDNAPWGMVRGTGLYLHMPSSFGSTNTYPGTAATYPAAKITQNGNTSIIIDYTFTYRT